MTEPRFVDDGLEWRRLHFLDPVSSVRVAAALRTLAAHPKSRRVVFECRASGGEVRYLVGAKKSAMPEVLAVLDSVLDVTVTKEGVERQGVRTAGRIKASTRHRALNTEPHRFELASRSVLGSLTRARDEEELVLHEVLGLNRVPRSVPAKSPSSVVAPWPEVAWYGKGAATVDPEKRAALRDKVGDHGFACSVRLGVRAATPARRSALILGLLAALRTGETPGLKLRLTHETPRRFDSAGMANWHWPLRLNVKELTALTGWPMDADDLPGQPAAHPKPLAPAPDQSRRGRLIATATAPGVDRGLFLHAKEALHHVHVAGPTGVGKSALLANLIIQDVAEGRAVVLIEPKGDLVDDVLDRIPPERMDDVVVLDPNEQAPVGLNPMQAIGRNPEVVADTLLATFKQLYGDALGPRSADILYAGLLTLARHRGASLVQLPLLLSNASFRRRLTAGLRDPVFLGPFWDTYERWSPGEQAAAVAPVMNKLRPLLRPTMRAVLGQPEPRFTLQQVFTERKILLVPLRRGVIGPDAAQLLGSLVTAELWQTVQSRTQVLPAKRHPVMVYIDEVQDYLKLPLDLSEALAQARGLGVGFTLAHQYLDQLPTAMRTAVLANARSRVVFQTEASDAVTFARGHKEIAPEDFTALGQYSVYASLFDHGQVRPYASGKTLPLPKPLGTAAKVRASSRERYGVPVEEIEASFAATLAADDVAGRTGQSGRRLRPVPDPEEGP